MQKALSHFAYRISCGLESLKKSVFPSFPLLSVFPPLHTSLSYPLLPLAILFVSQNLTLIMTDKCQSSAPVIHLNQ